MDSVATSQLQGFCSALELGLYRVCGVPVYVLTVVVLQTSQKKKVMLVSLLTPLDMDERVDEYMRKRVIHRHLINGVSPPRMNGLRETGRCSEVRNYLGFQGLLYIYRIYLKHS